MLKFSSLFQPASGGASSLGTGRCRPESLRGTRIHVPLQFRLCREWCCVPLGPPLAIPLYEPEGATLFRHEKFLMPSFIGYCSALMRGNIHEIDSSTKVTGECGVTVSVEKISMVPRQLPFLTISNHSASMPNSGNLFNISMFLPTVTLIGST